MLYPCQKHSRMKNTNYIFVPLSLIAFAQRDSVFLMLNWCWITKRWPIFWWVNTSMGIRNMGFEKSSKILLTPVKRWWNQQKAWKNIGLGRMNRMFPFIWTKPAAQWASRIMEAGWPWISLKIIFWMWGSPITDPMITCYRAIGINRLVIMELVFWHALCCPTLSEWLQSIFLPRNQFA